MIRKRHHTIPAIILVIALSALSLPARALTLEITELNFPDGAEATGSIMTNGTIGAINANDFLSWNIAVTAGTSTRAFTFTEANSDFLIIGPVMFDDNKLVVDVQNGVLQVQSFLPSSPSGPGHVLSLARFDFSRNSAAFSNRAGGFTSTSIDPLVAFGVTSYVAAEATEAVVTVPTPSSLLLVLAGLLASWRTRIRLKAT